ncbi:MAG: hypothetical protein ABSF69_21685 [Polyangiaceae bacterium]|jgi:hypothetical protein
MKVSKQKQLVDKSKAVRAMRAKVGWTRGTWVNEVEQKLGEAFLVFTRAKLAERNGPKRRTLGWKLEFDRVLHVGIIDIAIHPVKREFDRRQAFEQAVAEMSRRTILALQEHVEREFVKAVGTVRRGLEDADIEDFWEEARAAARILLGEEVAQGARVRPKSAGEVRPNRHRRSRI